MPAHDAAADLRERLQKAFVWQGDRTDASSFADMTGWWRDAETLSRLGPGLAGLRAGAGATVVVGIESRGSLLGPLAASALGVGFLEVRKDRRPSADSDAWLQATTRPDYRDRHLRLGLRAGHLEAGDRVLAVDDWIETGGQTLAARRSPLADLWTTLARHGSGWPS